MYYIKEIFENGKLGDFTKSPKVAQNVGYMITKEDNEVKQSDIDLQYYLIEVCPMKTEEMKEQEEKERVAKLTCTKRVFALMLQELGITYTQLKELISTNEQAQLEWDLCVELQRANPLLDIMANQLGITPEQLDGLFKYANGEITIEEFRGLVVVEELT